MTTRHGRTARCAGIGRRGRISLAGWAGGAIALALLTVAAPAGAQDGDTAVLPHPVDGLADMALMVASPDTVRGIIQVPGLTASRSAASPVPVAAPTAQRAAPASKDVEYRVHFASLRSETEANDLRARLLSEHAALLAGAGAEVEPLAPGGYRVRSGPLKDEAAARAICAGLAVAAPGCQPAKSMKIPVAGAAPAAPAPVAAPRRAAASAPPSPDAAAGQGDAAASARLWRVQVAAGRTEEEARLRWSRLIGANADLLDAAELFIIKADLGERGVFYRVQIGGFETRPPAVRFCETLRTRKVDCFVTAAAP